MTNVNAAYVADQIVSLGEADVKSETIMRIGDVSEMFNVSLRTLRFYEDKGLISPTRNGVTRLYDRKDIARIKLILRGRKIGFSLREVKQLIDLYEPDGANISQLKALSEKGKRQLEKLKQQRLEIDQSINDLIEGLSLVAIRLDAPRLVA